MKEKSGCPADRDVIVERLLAEVQRREGMEAALIRASEEWRATFDASRDLILLTDAAGAVVKANRAVAGLFGRPFAEIIGRQVSALLGEDGGASRRRPPGRHARQRDEERSGDGPRRPAGSGSRPLPTPSATARGGCAARS